jgi:hypothetical protein
MIYLKHIYQKCKTREKVFGAIMSQEVEVKVEKKFASVSFEEIEKISQEEQGKYENSP